MFRIEFETAEFVGGVPRSLEELRQACVNYVQQTGGRVLERARELAPVGTAAEEHSGRKPGSLRDSLYVTDIKVSARQVSVTVGSDDPVAFYQEFGTRKMRPHPFLRPAMSEARGATFSGASAARLVGSRQSSRARVAAVARQRQRRAALRGG